MMFSAHLDFAEINWYGLEKGDATLDVLNMRKNSFNYGPTLNRNKAEDYISIGMMEYGIF
jgi:hypothetical protein